MSYYLHRDAGCSCEVVVERCERLGEGARSRGERRHGPEEAAGEGGRRARSSVEDWVEWDEHLSGKLCGHAGEEDGHLLSLLERWEVTASDGDKESLAASCDGVADEGSLAILGVGLDRGANEGNERGGVAKGAVRGRHGEEKRGLTDEAGGSDRDIVLCHAVKESSVHGVDSDVDASGGWAHGECARVDEAATKGLGNVSDAGCISNGGRP